MDRWKLACVSPGVARRRRRRVLDAIHACLGPKADKASERFDASLTFGAPAGEYVLLHGVPSLLVLCRSSWYGCRTVLRRSRGECPRYRYGDGSTSVQRRAAMARRRRHTCVVPVGEHWRRPRSSYLLPSKGVHAIRQAAKLRVRTPSGSCGPHGPVRPRFVARAQPRKTEPTSAAGSGQSRAAR
jgi:hypothetical protein